MVTKRKMKNSIIKSLGETYRRHEGGIDRHLLFSFEMDNVIDRFYSEERSKYIISLEFIQLDMLVCEKKLYIVDAISELLDNSDKTRNLILLILIEIVVKYSRHANSELWFNKKKFKLYNWRTLMSMELEDSIRGIPIDDVDLMLVPLTWIGVTDLFSVDTMYELVVDMMPNEHGYFIGWLGDELAVFIKD